MRQENVHGLDRGQFWKELNERWNAATNKEELEREQLLFEEKRREERRKEEEEFQILSETLDDNFTDEMDKPAGQLCDTPNKESANNQDELSLQTFYDVPSLKTETSSSEMSPKPKGVLLLPSPPARLVDRLPLGANNDTPILPRSSDESLRVFQSLWESQNKKLQTLKIRRSEYRHKAHNSQRLFYISLIKLKAATARTVDSYDELWDLEKQVVAKNEEYDSKCRALKRAMKEGGDYKKLANSVNGLKAELEGLKENLQQKKEVRDERVEEFARMDEEQAKAKAHKDEMAAELRVIDMQINDLESGPM